MLGGESDVGFFVRGCEFGLLSDCLGLWYDGTRSEMPPIPALPLLVLESDDHATP